MSDTKVERTETTLNKFLKSLKIKGLSRRKAKKIAEYCDYEWYDFCQVLFDDGIGFCAIKGITAELNQAIRNKFTEMEQNGGIEILKTLQFVTPKRYKSNCDE